ncbi:unnamed protein product [Rotaria sp. Silwood1]|nr:unnamed protein product [Rotaria sp. Silwood1]
MLNTFFKHRSINPIIFTQRYLTVKSDVDLNVQMKLLNDRKQFRKSLDLFDKYKENNINKLSSSTITQALKACAQICDLERGSTIHRLISSRINNDFYILASLIHLYMQCSDVSRAESLFDRSNKKTKAMYGAMMKGYIKNNMSEKAIELFNKIQTPDEVIVTLLFNACAQLETTEALNLVKKISKEIPKSFYWNPFVSTSLLDAFIKYYGSLMNGFIKDNNPEKVLNLFNQMKIDGIEANEMIYLYVIKALCQIADYSLSKSIIEKIPNSFLVNHQIQNSLIHMWGKIGYVDTAQVMFENISQPDQIGYTAMINAYGLNGLGIKAIELYHKMPVEYINEATYVSVLNACSHSGLIDEARSIFKNIQLKTVKIYTTMIDCLSRGSFLNEAQQLINEFECYHPPSPIMYS